MKKCLFVVSFLFTCITFSQNNHIVKIEDGRRILLKSDFTWEYIDVQLLTLVDSAEVKNANPIKSSTCIVSEGFVEPRLSPKTQGQLKKGRATISDIKKKVAKDYNCDVEDVILLTVSEKKAFGNYTFCAKGEKVFYKRNGYKILEKGKLF